MLKLPSGNSPAVSWAGLCALTAGDVGSVPGLGTKLPQAAPHDLIRKERKTGLTENLTNKIRKSKTALRNEWENFMNVSTLFSRFHISEFNSFWNVPNPRIFAFPIRDPTPFVLSLHFTEPPPYPLGFSAPGWLAFVMIHTPV